jgi:hypothetical protein
MTVLIMLHTLAQSLVGEQSGGSSVGGGDAAVDEIAEANRTAQGIVDEFEETAMAAHKQADDAQNRADIVTSLMACQASQVARQDRAAGEGQHRLTRKATNFDRLFAAAFADNNHDEEEYGEAYVERKVKYLVALLTLLRDTSVPAFSRQSSHFHTDPALEKLRQRLTQYETEVLGADVNGVDDILGGLGVTMYPRLLRTILDSPVWTWSVRLRFDAMQKK